jgi:hypothetical protein
MALNIYGYIDKTRWDLKQYRALNQNWTILKSWKGKENPDFGVMHTHRGLLYVQVGLP